MPAATPSNGYLDRLKRIVNDVIAPAAVDVDQSGMIPRAGLVALG
jgi:hypothetical protein